MKLCSTQTDEKIMDILQKYSHWWWIHRIQRRWRHSPLFQSSLWCRPTPRWSSALSTWTRWRTSPSQFWSSSYTIPKNEASTSALKINQNAKHTLVWITINSLTWPNGENRIINKSPVDTLPDGDGDTLVVPLGNGVNSSLNRLVVAPPRLVHDDGSSLGHSHSLHGPLHSECALFLYNALLVIRPIRFTYSSKVSSLLAPSDTAPDIPYDTTVSCPELRPAELEEIQPQKAPPSNEDLPLSMNSLNLECTLSLGTALPYTVGRSAQLKISLAARKWDGRLKFCGGEISLAGNPYIEPFWSSNWGSFWK